MFERKKGLAGFALVCGLTAGAWQMGMAQGPPPPPSAYDSPNWQAPRGYDEYYHEGGSPNMVARQGYAAGFNQGESDFQRHKKFQPHEAHAYEHVPDIPKGFDKNEFKHIYREAFERGYSRGYRQ